MNYQQKGDFKFFLLFPKVNFLVAFLTNSFVVGWIGSCNMEQGNPCLLELLINIKTVILNTMKIKDTRLHLLVVEDDEGFAYLLRLILQDLGVAHIEVAKNFDEALRCLQQQCPQICLIDIDLGQGEKTGILLAEKIRQTQQNLPIIYLTSDYTEESYQKSKHTCPSSFMNKELSWLKLYQAIDLALVELQKFDSQIVAKAEAISRKEKNRIPYTNNSQLFFKIGDFYKNIPIKEIAFFYASEKMTFARVHKRNFPTNVQLKILEDELFPIFLRIHKTYLINVDYIDFINTKEDRVELLGESIPIGYSHRKAFLEQLKLLK